MSWNSRDDELVEEDFPSRALLLGRIGFDLFCGFFRRLGLSGLLEWIFPFSGIRRLLPGAPSSVGMVFLRGTPLLA